MSKVTFHGLSAWVGAIHGPTVCDWWSSDPAQLKWDRSLLNTVDLAKTPSAAVAGSITVAQIEVDDFSTSGGRTTIGPLWPGGATIGACWLSDAKFAAHIGPGVPGGTGGHSYEWQAIYYFDNEQGNRRFYGFHATLTQIQNHLSLVQIWHPGTGAAGGKPAGAWWLDLAADADPNTPALTPNLPAALFLDQNTVRKLALIEPKAPPFKGGFAFPR